ncbi:Nicotinate dehydrogenase subunit B [Lacunisphaera limnophila]|uniref:Nicotinate dehydrogenase subunit B n=1 Tax=Lacunisphaera limnophila TaxID=1838286 RepID=A0A1D8AX52_9BACT|nr:molybdopterin cofactor-binding domain-containing protein [Lacunisphaera limnophila]AOS45472.1 Nicotinate dehydrogenase subunit B [Lacunisphaera limnophila]
MNPVTPSPVGLVAASASRRNFLKRFGSGLFICIVVGHALGEEESEASFQTKPRVVPKGTIDFNALLRIGEDGRVTCFTGKIEMGQGPVTSLPQMLAEELDVAVDDIDIVMGDTDLCPYDQGTWGSLTTRVFGLQWSQAGAAARTVLLELAAEALRVPVTGLTVRQGVVSVTSDPSRRISYGQLTQGRRIERELVVPPVLKQPSEFKVVGQPLRRRDARDKVTGKAKYTGDLRLPGMLYASILRPPAHGATLRRIDASAVHGRDGCLVVQEPDLVAVLHELPERAEEALPDLQAEFDPSPSTLDNGNLYTHLAQAEVPSRVVKQAGELERGRARAVRPLEATYFNAYVAHAAMEPHTALAQVVDGKVTVWASTQNPFGVRAEIAQVLGVPEEQVRVITPFVGGGFGGKAMNRQAVEAARLARATGRPVQVAWSREEEFSLSNSRPAAVVRVAAGLDDAGRIAFWDYAVRFAGDRGSDLLYDVPDHRISAVGNFNGPPEVHPMPIGAWRAPGCSTNAFARESHIDRLAELAGVDPIEFRLRHLTNPRARRVLEAAAAGWGWQPGQGVTGRGLGVALGLDAGTYVATIAEVAVDPVTGAVRVKRVLCAQDMGRVINPAGAKEQMEGCIMMGLGYALTEEIRFKAGVVLDTNFDTYELPRFSWLPKIETVILDLMDEPAQGGGEPAVIVMGAVLANAIHDVTGARLLELPMTPARVKAAMGGVA